MLYITRLNLSSRKKTQCRNRLQEDLFIVNPVSHLQNCYQNNSSFTISHLQNCYQNNIDIINLHFTSIVELQGIGGPGVVGWGAGA